MFDDKSAVDPTGLRAQIAESLSPEATLAEAIRFEVVLAETQATLGIIPDWAAGEIARAAREAPPSVDQVRVHRRRVGHPMVAILEAFSEGLSSEAAEWLHYGTTTADVFRTVRMVQMHAVAEVFLDALRQVEAEMADIARETRATPMIGRTLGRHALPITFGYKVAVWMSETRRCIDRLAAWRQRYPSGVLSGAVGTHAVMGRKGREVEIAVMQRLGLGEPGHADSKGSTDVFADFGSALAIAARVFGRIAQEVFLLQGDDIREVALVSKAVGSSTMPHKSNPTVCIEIMSRSREVAAALPVLLEWILIIHERDSAQHGAVLEEMCIDMAQVLSCMAGLIRTIQVRPKQMRQNLLRTKGAILAENVTVQLAKTIGRRSAHHLMQEVMEQMNAEGATLAEALAADPRTKDVSIPKETDAYGQSPELVDLTLADLGYEAKDSGSTAEFCTR